MKHDEVWYDDFMMKYDVSRCSQRTVEMLLTWSSQHANVVI